MSARGAFASSVKKFDRSIPAAAKAASVGAKTVKGPSAWRAATRLACYRAATRLPWEPVACALAGMSWVSSADTLRGVTEIKRQATIRNTLIRFIVRGVVSEYIYRSFLPMRKEICIRGHLLRFAAIGCILPHGRTEQVPRF